MRGKGGRADVIDTPEGRECREAAFAKLQGRPKARVVKAPTLRSGANDNNPMLQLEKLIERKMLVAADVLRRMSIGAGGYPASAGSGWPDVVRDYWESARYAVRDIPRVMPSPKEIDSAIDLMMQLTKMTERERKIISAKAFGFSYRHLGREFHCSHEKIRGEHRQALLVFAMTIQISV